MRCPRACRNLKDWIPPLGRSGILHSRECSRPDSQSDFCPNAYQAIPHSVYVHGKSLWTLIDRLDAGFQYLHRYVLTSHYRNAAQRSMPLARMREACTSHNGQSVGQSRRAAVDVKWADSHEKAPPLILLRERGQCFQV